MKKIIPLLVLSAGVVLASNSSLTTNMDTNFNLKNNVQAFTNSIKQMKAQPETIKVLSKYIVSINNENTQDIDYQNIDNSQINEIITSENDENNNDSTILNNEPTFIDNSNDTVPLDSSIINDEILQEDDSIDIDDTVDTINSEVKDDDSTIYSLNEDIEKSCNEFCELKEELLEAIVDTENLLDKINSNELTLTSAEKTYLREQVSQLNSLGNELTRVTNTLSFELSDLGEMIRNGEDENMKTLKYLVILENLNNSNLTLRNSLSTLNMINRLNYSLPYNVPGGRMIYGYKINNQPPVVKDYTINENGEISENNEQNQDNQNIDSYDNTNLVSNIDTYGNYNQNIDTFFNTALLDNEFMYGNGYGGGFGMYPFMSNYSHYQRGNQYNNEVNHSNNNTVKDFENKETNEISKNFNKKFKLQKNIDTFRDENTPDLKTKFNNIKASINGFFSKFKKPNQQIENPIYRQDMSSNQDAEEI